MTLLPTQYNVTFENMSAITLTISQLGLLQGGKERLTRKVFKIKNYAGFIFFFIKNNFGHLLKNWIARLIENH